MLEVILLRSCLWVVLWSFQVILKTSRSIVMCLRIRLSYQGLGTHTILKNREYFSNLKLLHANVNTISGITKLIEGTGKACIILSMGTKLVINDALYSSKSRSNLISFKAIRQNGYHVETNTINEKEFLCLIIESNGTKIILERMSAY